MGSAEKLHLILYTESIQGDKMLFLWLNGLITHLAFPQHHQHKQTVGRLGGERDRQADRQTDRQTDRHTDRQKQREGEGVI